jgi:hypothetical protein
LRCVENAATDDSKSSQERWKFRATREIRSDRSGEDRTPFELFVTGAQDWEADLRWQMESDKPNLE